MHFSFEKHARPQVLKDFSIENLETTPSTFLSNFFSEIYLYQITSYWGSVFTLYLTWGAFSLVCVLSVLFLSFFFFFFFLFLSIFFLKDTNNSQDSSEGRGNRYFSCFPLPPAHGHSFSSSRFLPLLFNRSICNYQTDSEWYLFSLDICILFIFSLMPLSQTLTFQSDIVRISARIKLSSFYYKGNTFY